MSHKEAPRVQLSLAESTLNAIWRCDRKRGQTFWSNQGEQFAIMQAALDATWNEAIEAARNEIKRRSCTCDECLSFVSALKKEPKR